MRVGILHPAAPSSTVGVVLVVGGPQYRVGSHRQFVTIARAMAGAVTGADSLPMRMADGLCRFNGRALLILSGNDLTAREFEDAAKGPAWRGLLDAPRVTSVRLPGADHTFSQSPSGKFGVRNMVVAG